MNINNTSLGKQYNNVGGGSQYNAEVITIHHAANDPGDKDRQFLIDLKLSDPRLDKERIERTKGGLWKESYLWILDNEDFQRWRADFQNRLLWIRGDPGKGKTMLLCGIVDELLKEKSTNQPFYFFSQATDSNLNTASAVLRGILYLILKKNLHLVKDLRETHDHCDRQLFDDSNGWDTLCNMVISVLCSEGLQNAVIVIDALDECTKGVDKLLDFINTLSSKAVRVIVSSRNWPTIERGIAGAARQAAHVSLELNERSISDAVVALIKHKVDQLAQKHEYSAATRNSVYETLIQKSNSTFLWAALVCQQLADNNINGWEVESRLAEFPPGLDVLYARMLDQTFSSSNSSLFRRILAVASVVFRPVNTAEMRSLLGPLGSVFKDTQSLEKAIRQCGSFLTVRNNTVYFVHQSAKDFLLETTAIEKVMLEGIVHEHTLIWTTSLQAMSKTLRNNIYNLRSPGTSVDDVQPPSPDPLAPVGYSCTHWIEHLYMTGIEQYQAGHMEYFFRHLFLHWAEALCLLKSVHQGVESMSKLYHTLENTVFSKLVALLQDGLRFLQQHRDVIEKAPLQIYCSALLFSPKKSLVRELYPHEVPDWILTKPLVKEEQWNPSLQVLGHHQRCQTLVYSRNGNILASTSLEEMKFWDAITGQCLRTIRSSDGRVGQVTLSYDGRKAAAVLGDFQCKLWNVETGDCLQALQYHPGKINSIAISQNGRQLGMGSEDTTVTLWDTETGMCLRVLRGQESPVTAVVFSPDGCRIASAATSIKIWNAQTGLLLQEMQPNVDFQLSSILYTHEGRRIVSLCMDPRWYHEGCSIGIWETSTGQCLQEKCILGTKYINTEDDQSAFSLSPHNGGVLACRTGAKTTKVWHLETGARRDTTVLPYRIAGVAISNDSEKLAIVSSQGTIGIQNLETYRRQQHETKSLPQGNLILSNTWLSALSINQSLEESSQPSNSWSESFSRITSLIHMLSTCSIASTILKQIYRTRGPESNTARGNHGIDTSSAQVDGSFAPTQSVNFSVDCQRAVSARQGQLMVDIWDTRNGQCLQSLRLRDETGEYQVHVEVNSTAAFTRENQILLATVYLFEVNIFDATEGSHLAKLFVGDQYDDGYPQAITFSGDATRLAVSRFPKPGILRGFVQIWSLTAGRWQRAWKFYSMEAAIPRTMSSPKSFFPPSFFSSSLEPRLAQWFSPAGSQLHTSYGTIELSVVDKSRRETMVQNQSEPFAQVSKLPPRGYYIDGHWIMKDWERLLWLPEEYRPWNGAYVVRESALAIGCDSGHVIIFQFSHKS